MRRAHAVSGVLLAGPAQPLWHELEAHAQEIADELARVAEENGSNHLPGYRKGPTPFFFLVIIIILVSGSQESKGSAADRRKLSIGMCQDRSLGTFRSS